MRPTYALINLSNLKRNFLNIRKKVKNARVMAVVKADAYGHGVKETCLTLNSLGDKKPDYYAVAFIDEAIELRSLGITEPILIFEPVFEQVHASANSLHPSRFSVAEKSEIVVVIINNENKRDLFTVLLLRIWF